MVKDTAFVEAILSPAGKIGGYIPKPIKYVAGYLKDGVLKKIAKVTGLYMVYFDSLMLKYDYFKKRKKEIKDYKKFLIFTIKGSILTFLVVLIINNTVFDYLIMYILLATLFGYYTHEGWYLVSEFNEIH